MADLTTVESVKQFMGRVDNVDDSLLESMVAAYSQWVCSVTGRNFAVQTYDIVRSGRGGPVLMLPQWPIQSVQLVEVDGQALPAAPAYGSYGYRFDNQQIILSGGAVFTIGNSNVRIQFTAGYPQIPADIAQAVNELVTLRFRMRDKIEWVSKSLASETVTLNQRDMPATVATVLRQYRAAPARRHRWRHDVASRGPDRVLGRRHRAGRDGLPAGMADRGGRAPCFPGLRVGLLP
ncbi:head-tail connector protein [Novosphingobium piscinae]|uniref:Phage gp6-like head-tail connector protein n=1 Tax=Novosphingobium piscinae TaxID=1507448 RepID=A0A7X1KPH6_9SPHN|nr:head-tail connector protein [Novosphingobium piscinae]MBC2668756.1 phage gp6-like head-tail connector protein [Novosphingobium piscinae]